MLNQPRKLTGAMLLTREIEPGWGIIDATVPIGKRYAIDSGSSREATLMNAALGKVRRVDCVPTYEGGCCTGWLPLAVLKVDADS